MKYLREALTKGSEQQRIQVIEALEILRGSAPSGFLMAALCDSSWNVRATAARALGHLGEHMPVGYLEHVLKSEQDESVREAIVRTLGKQERYMPVELLLSLLHTDASWLVREAAAWTLGHLGKYAPIGDLATSLRCDPDASVRAAAARALGRSERSLAEKALLAVFDGSEEEEEVRDAALQALNQLADTLHRSKKPIANEPFTFHSKTKDEDRDSLPKNQCQAQPERILFALTEFLRDKKGYVEKEQLRYTDQEEILQIWCGYETTAVCALREAVLQQIQRLPDLLTVSSITTMLESQDAIVREAVGRAIETGKKRPWQELLIVSLAFPHQPRKQGCESASASKRIRVVVTGASYPHVRGKDQPVLRELVAAWTRTTDERLICERPQALTDLRMWYQPASDSQCWYSLVV